MNNHGLINLHAAQAAPKSGAQIESYWRSEAKSSDALTAAVALYGLKKLEENRRNETLELVETMRPFLDQHLSTFIKRAKIKGERTQRHSPQTLPSSGGSGRTRPGFPISRSRCRQT